MSITHEEAQRLIQFRADDGLNLGEEAKLSAHLNECAECRTYSNGLKSTISILHGAMRKQWNAVPPPLQMDSITAKVSFRKSRRDFLTIRSTLVGFAIVLFTFIVWQSMASDNKASQQFSSRLIPMIPTPSIQHTATNISLTDCQNIKYNIQEGDTLEDIARQFSVPATSILLANNLTDTTLTSIREIVIPICETTPTSTTFPPTFTITPIFEPVLTTPG